MRKRTHTAPPPRLAHYAERLQRESIFRIHRSSDWKADAERTCFGPDGIYGRLSSRHVTRYYRMAEMLDNPDHIAHYIDHHAGNAYWKAMLWATSTTPLCPLHVPGMDSPRHLADLVTQFPEMMRDRLDTVLEGLHEEADPDGYYEQRFLDLCAEWHTAMRTAYAMTARGHGRYEQRLRLCRQAAEELFPGWLDWFDDLRHTVCDGGHTAAWEWGDARRGETWSVVPRATISGLLDH